VTGLEAPAVVQNVMTATGIETTATRRGTGRETVIVTVTVQTGGGGQGLRNHPETGIAGGLPRQTGERTTETFETPETKSGHRLMKMARTKPLTRFKPLLATKHIRDSHEKKKSIFLLRSTSMLIICPLIRE
jgi:hypothetical protein